MTGPIVPRHRAAIGRREVVAVGTGLSLAVVVRLVWMASSSFVLLNDAADYDRLGVNLASAGSFGPSVFAAVGGTALRPPLYPLMLGGLYRVVGHHVTAGRLLNVVLGASALALLWVVARRLFGRRVAFIALVTGAVYPPLVIADTSLMSEPLALVLLLLALGCVLVAVSHDRPARWAAVAGLVAGAACLTRPLALATVPVFIVMLVRGSERGWQSSGVFLLAMALAIAPWSIRNERVLSAFVPLTTQTGYHLAGTYNETARTDPAYRAEWRPANFDPSDGAITSKPGLNENEIDLRLRSGVFQFVRLHPSYVLSVAWVNARRLLDLRGFAFVRTSTLSEYGQGAKAAGFEIGGFAIVALLSVPAAFDRRSRRVWTIWLLPASLVVPSILVTSLPRFRHPAEPFLVLAVALTIDRIWTVWRASGSLRSQR